MGADEPVWIRGGTDADAVAALYAAVVERLGDGPPSRRRPGGAPVAGETVGRRGVGSTSGSTPSGPSTPASTTSAEAPGPLLVVPTADDAAAAQQRITESLDGVDAILATSGSADGRGRLVGLSLDALVASARATERRLGGPGQWLTSLPTHGVAGFQVVLRSALAGFEPVVYAPQSGFDLDLFAAQVARLRPDARHYLSFVPTQLSRALDVAPDLLGAFAAVLVGGARLAPDLADRAHRAGVRIVTTYGMTETSGGCVYDGVPLDGVEVMLRDGQILIAGPVLMERYVDAGEQPFASGVGQPAESGRTRGPGHPEGRTFPAEVARPRGTNEVRLLETHDLGEWDDGRLRVLGRSDDVIISGGVNVAPAVVEAALSLLGGTWVVVGALDPEWGQRVVAVTEKGDARSLAEVRQACADLPPAARPRAVETVDTWPLRPTGKIDRRAVRRMVEEKR